MDPQPMEEITVPQPVDFKTEQMLYHEKVCSGISYMLRYKMKNNPRNKNKWYVIYPMTCRDYKQYRYSLERDIYYMTGMLVAKDIAKTEEKIKMNKKYFSADILVKLLTSKGYDLVECKDERSVSCFGNVSPEFNYFRITKKV
jgi:hypothetical protein